MRLVSVLRYRSMTHKIAVTAVCGKLGLGRRHARRKHTRRESKATRPQYVREHVKEGDLQVSNNVAEVTRRLRVVSSRTPPATPSRQLPKRACG